MNSFLKNRTSKELADKTIQLADRFDEELKSIFWVILENNNIKMESNKETQAIFEAVRIAFTAGFEAAKNEN